MFPRHILIKKDEALKEMKRRCSLFNPSYSWDIQMDVRIARLMSSLARGDNDYVYTHGTPLNWQLLIQYLFEKGISKYPYFLFRDVQTDKPRFSFAALQGCETWATDGTTVKVEAYGTVGDAEEAMSRAIGELLERFLLTKYKNKDLISASLPSLASSGRCTLDITKLNGFLPWQIERYPHFQRSLDSSIRWVRGRELLSDKNAYIPAQLVFWNYRRDTEHNEPFLGQSTTNGAAGHFTRDQAILSGLLESIQRDGFLIFWLNMLTPKRIDAATIDNTEVQRQLAYLDRYQLKYYFLNTTSDLGIPSCTCVLIDDRSDPVIFVGSAAGFDLPEIILKSLAEATSMLRFTTEDRLVLADDYQPFSDSSITKNERVRLWKGNKMLEKFQFFIAGETQTAETFMSTAPSLPTAKERLAYVLTLFRQQGPGHEVYVYDVKDPILTALGYHVVKTVVPRLVALYLHEHLVTLDAPRLREVPEKIGHAASVKLNPWPHPFP